MTRPPWQWSPEMQTDEAKAAVQAWVDKKIAAGAVIDAHDPEFLFCLDKVDIISRYQLLLQQSRSREESTRVHYESEIRRLKSTVEKAGRWWDHCLKLRHGGRKTAILAGMNPPEGATK